MSKLTATEVRGLMEAYGAVYAPQQEDQEVQELGIEIIENAAYVLFSQGYDVEDVISYFTETANDVIVEDYVNFSEGNLILESVAVSDEYIEEQFQQLDERLGGLLSGAANLIGKGARAVGGAVKNVAKRAFGSRKIQPVVVKDVTGKGGALVKTGSSSLASPAASSTRAASSTGQNVFQKAGNWAKTQMGKISGVAQKVGQSGAGQFAKKVGSRVLPGLGVAAYGADAVSRAKKGDWGGAAISGIGAGLSAIPGVGTLASLAPAAVQMGTDALGLTGDKSKKGPNVKTAPSGDKVKYNASAALGGKTAFAAGGGAAAMKKDSKLTAADVQRRGNEALYKAGGGSAAMTQKGQTRSQVIAQGSKNVAKKSTPAAPAAPAASSAPEVKATNTIASKPSQPAVKPSGQLSPGGRRGNADLADKTFPTAKTKGGTEYEVRTPTSAEMAASKAAGGGEAGVKSAVERSAKPMGGPEGPGKIDTASVQSDLKAAQEREKNKTPKTTAPQTVKASYEYDAFDIILEYLLENGHADTVTEAAYIMTEMDSKTIADIVEKHATFGYNADDPGDDFDQFLEKGPKTNKQKRNAIMLNKKILSKPGMPVQGV